MRIYFSGPLPPLVTGQTIANDMAVRGLRALGHEVLVSNGAHPKGQVEDFQSQGRLIWKKVTAVGISAVKEFWTIRNAHPEVLYINPGLSFLGFVRYFPAVLAASWSGIPVVAHFHGGSFPIMYKTLPLFKRKLVDGMISLIRTIVALGKSLKDDLLTIEPDSAIQICENGVANEIILTPDEVASKMLRRAETRKIKVLYMSNILRSKGILDLIEAVRLLILQGQDVQLDIAGAIDADVREAFFESTEKLGLNSRFHGVVGGNNKRDLLKNADVLALPTYYPVEGQPISILEAYGAGCLVVTTDHGGIRDIFSDGANGYFCAAKEPNSIARAIFKTLTLPAETIERNVQLCKLRFSEASFAKRLDQILNQALDRSELSPNSPAKAPSKEPI